MQPLTPLSFVWKHVKPYKWLYLAMLLGTFASALYPFAYNYCVRWFLDLMVEEGGFRYERVIAPILLFLFIQCALDIAWRISNVAEWHAEPKVRRSIILESYDYVQHHSYRFFQNQFTGGITSKLKGIVDGYDKLLGELHHGAFMNLLQVIVNLIALTYINRYLGLFFVLWGSCYLFTIHKISKRLDGLAFQSSESRHSIIAGMGDRIANILTLFSCSSRKYERETLDRELKDDFIPKEVALYRANFFFQMVSGLLYLLMYGVILLIMVEQRRQGLVSVGDFAFVFGITFSAAESLWWTTLRLLELASAMGDFKSSLSILNTPQEGLDRPSARPLLLREPRITFEDLSFSHEERGLLFHHLNLTIDAGEKVGLVGYSGSGKSTLVHLILRYFSPMGGKITIDGQDIADVLQESLREKIALIPQETQCFHRTLMDNVRYGRVTATEVEVIEACQKAHIHEEIMALPHGYATYVGERGVKLSGGQRQRIAIARAILKNAPILILDEATSSLDSLTEAKIQDSLNLLMEDRTKSVIAIAHRLSTLKHMDRIIVLDQGTIVEEGSHEQLLNQPTSFYKRLWETQAI